MAEPKFTLYAQRITAKAGVEIDFINENDVTASALIHRSFETDSKVKGEQVDRSNNLICRCAISNLVVTHS
jgi:hypothetical protein